MNLVETKYEVLKDSNKTLLGDFPMEKVLHLGVTIDKYNIYNENRSYKSSVDITRPKITHDYADTVILIGDDDKLQKYSKKVKVFATFEDFIEKAKFILMIF